MIQKYYIPLSFLRISPFQNKENYLNFDYQNTSNTNS